MAHEGETPDGTKWSVGLTCGGEPLSGQEPMGIECRIVVKWLNPFLALVLAHEQGEAERN